MNNNFIKRNTTQNYSKKFKYIPNSRKQFEEEGSNLQVISLATNLPKINIENNENKNKMFKEFLRKNWFLSLYQELEQKLYINGIYALGLEKTSFPSTPKIKLAQVINYKIKNHKLVYLKVIIDLKKTSGGNYQLIEEYDLDSKETHIKNYAFNITARQRKQTEQIFSEYEPKTNILKFIPYVVFQNRWDSKKDLDLVNPEHFELLDTLYSQLRVEGYYSNPLYLVSANQGGARPEEVVKALFDDENRVVKSSSLSNFALTKTLEQFHGIPLTQYIVQKIESVKYWIKDALFFKKNSQDGGTKNMHSLEAQNLNSNFEDYIETKANLREQLFATFIELYFEFIKIDIDIDNVDVTITGSTKWLENQAQKAITNQQGITLNQTRGEKRE